MAVFAYSYSLGVEGLKEGLHKIGELIAQAMGDRRIIAWARRAMWEASLPVNASRPAIVAAIYAKQRSDMVFAEDPYATELMMSAVKLLCLDPQGECVRGGDCDDNVIVLASALMSVGIPVRLLVRNYPKMGQLHVMIQYDADPLNGGNWTCFDATSPNGACFAGFTSEAVVSLEVGPMIVDKQPPRLLVLGRGPLLGASTTSEITKYVLTTSGQATVPVAPGATIEFDLPDEHAYWQTALSVDGNATIGSAPSSGNNPASITYKGGGASVTAKWWPCCSDVPFMPPAPPLHIANLTLVDMTTNAAVTPMTTTTTTTTATATSALSADQTDAWVEIVTRAKDRLDASIDRLNFYTGQLEAVRNDLGMPDVDPTPPAGEASPGSSPLDVYSTQGFAWTSDVQNAQAKLVQTGTFLSGVLGDALAGARQLYWNEGDLFVAAVDGDPYGVLMKPIGAAGSALFPSYVDVQSGSVTGKIGFGIAPILIGIGIVVASLAAVYAVVKIVDYLASAHRDDAVGKIAAAQQALVAEGKQTPEQAAAFMKASADLVSAPPAAAAAGGLSLGWLFAAALGGALAGVVGAELVPKLLGARLSFAPATA